MISLGTWAMGAPVEVNGVRVVTYSNAQGVDWYQAVAWSADRPAGLAVIVNADDLVMSAGSDVNELHPVGGEVLVLDDPHTPSQAVGMKLDRETGQLRAPPPTSIDVDRERVRRIAAGFLFQTKRIQFDDRSKANISGAVQLAKLALAGEVEWPADFAWIAADNSLLPLTAEAMTVLGVSAAAWERRHIFAARAIKNMSPIPDDYAADARWPSE